MQQTYDTIRTLVVFYYATNLGYQEPLVVSYYATNIGYQEPWLCLTMQQT